MQEAGGMDEFNGGRQRIAMLSRIAAQLGADQVQQRTKALAAAVNQVVGDFGNQLDVGCDVAVQVNFNLIHFACVS